MQGLKRAKIAKEDIECWKFLTQSKRPIYKLLHGVDFQYELNIIQPRVAIRKEKPYSWCSTYEINKGYHSYISKRVAKKEYGIMKPPSEKLFRFIIPKGTRYYKNETEYVSETIMLVDNEN